MTNIETLHWHSASSVPDADMTCLLWVQYADGECDWSGGWWDGDGWRLCESGGLVADAGGTVLHWAEPAGPAEPQPEPVSRDQIRDMVKECGLDWHRGFAPLFAGDDTNRYEVLVREAVERYAEPQAQRQPLTREQIDRIWSAQGSFTDRESDYRCFARAIERAHGIGKP